MENAIAIKDSGKIIKQSELLVRKANEIVIKSDTSCQEATDFATTLKAFIDGPGKYHDDDIDMVNALKASLMEKWHAINDGPKAAYKILKDKIGGYVAEKKRRIAEAQAKAEAEAREKERVKQVEIQAKIDAENARLRKIREDEQRKRDEADAEIERQKSKAKREQMEKDEAERRKAEKERIDKEKEKIKDRKEVLVEKKEAVYVAPRAVPNNTPDNVSVSFAWEASVTNFASVPDVYKTINFSLLERDQKAAQGALKIPGVIFTRKAIGALRKDRS